MDIINIYIYWLCPRLVISSSYTHNIFRMGGNTSLTCFSLCHNIHQHEDGMVVLQFWPNLIMYLGCAEAWIDGIPVYIHCVSGVLGLSHVPITFVECLVTHPRLVVLHITTYSVLMPNLIPQLGWSEVCMDRILVHCLCHMLVRSCPCIHKTCGRVGNKSMICGSLWNNIRQPEDGMVVLQFSPNLVPQFGCSVAWIWMDRVPLFIDYI